MKLMRFVLGCALVAVSGCASKPKFFQTQAERDEAYKRSPEYEAKQAKWKAEADAMTQKRRQEREKYVNANPNIKPAIAEAIREGSIMRGMNEEQVVVVMGKPENINRSTGPSGRSDQWVYGGGAYVYFRNGIVDGWQTRE